MKKKISSVDYVGFPFGMYYLKCNKKCRKAIKKAGFPLK